MLSKAGNKLPRRPERLSESADAAAISEALEAEFGTSASAAQQIQRWTGVADRTARNWLYGVVGPRGYHLMGLAREPDAVLLAVIAMMNKAGAGAGT